MSFKVWTVADWEMQKQLLQNTKKDIIIILARIYKLLLLAEAKHSGLQW